MYSYVVYVDEVLIGNFIINFVILWATARLAGLKIIKWRLVLGSILGAFYSIILYIPALAFLFSVFFKLLGSVIIVLFVFGTMPAVRFLLALGYFYFTSFAMGGIVFGVGYFLGLGQDPAPVLGDFFLEVKDFFWYGILLAIVGIYMLAKWGPAFWKRHTSDEIYYYQLGINFGGETVTVNSFLDTGNHLSDPLTGHPVIVVEYDAVKHLLPGEIRKAMGIQMQDEDSLEKMLEALSDSGWAARFRVIPYHTVGMAGSLLYGFSPDKVSLSGDRGDIIFGKVIIGICRRPLSPEATYQALLHPRLFDKSD